jgi:hypothetical protein
MGILLMVMTVGGLLVAGVLLAIAWLNESAWLKKFVLGGVAIWLAFYAVMLIGVSLMSSERTIEIGDTDGKEYCGFYLDCHMHTMVSRVRRAKSIGSRTAKGEFYIIAVKVFSNAKAATLGLSTVGAHVVDSTGSTYTRDLQAEDELGPQPGFEDKIGPSESFVKEIVFDLPVGVKGPRLDIREGGINGLIEAFLIGDEDSIFHKRNYFKLQEQNVGVSVK